MNREELLNYSDRGTLRVFHPANFRFTNAETGDRIVAMLRTRVSLPRLPWDRIVLVLAVAGVAAWFVGFAAGLIVRFVVGF